MKFLYNDELLNNKNQIDELNTKSIYGNAFHTIDMYQFYLKVDKHEPVFIGLCDEDNHLMAMVLAVIQYEKGGLKKQLSSRAIVFSGPVITAGEREEYYLKEILSHLVTYLKNKVIYIEFRNFHNYKKYINIYKKMGFSYKEHLNFHLNCSPEIDLFINMNSSRRRNIRKSLKEGAEIIEPRHLKDVKEFYSILHQLYRDKVKKPLPKFDYFQTFYEMNIGKYFLVLYNKEILGGIMCPILPGKTIYEFYVAGKDHKYKKIHPSVLATYAALDYAQKNDILIFDFMGAGSSSKNYGVRDFKSNFGGDLIEHGRFIRINKPLFYIFGKLAVKIMSKLK